MQYEVEINGRRRRVTIQRAAGPSDTYGTFSVDIDGTTRTVSAERIDAHTLSLLVGDVAAVGSAAAITPGSVASGASRTSVASASVASGCITSHEVTVAPNGPSGHVRVTVGPRTIAVSLDDRRRKGRLDQAASGAGGPERIVAPMPGKIVRVLVAAGTAVRAGQPVVVVEAMKMENELRATRPGVVQEVHVQDGQSVEAGGLLVVIAGPAE